MKLLKLFVFFAVLFCLLLPAPTPMQAQGPFFRLLQLTSICSNDPAVTRAWRVTNPNGIPINFRWLTNNGRTGGGTVPAMGSTTFQTPTHPGPNIVLLFRSIFLQDIAVSSGRKCSTDPDAAVYEPPLVVITAWSVEGTKFTWEYSPTGKDPWYKIVDGNGVQIVTTAEWKDRYNDVVGKVVPTPLTRLVLGRDGDPNPRHYRITNESGQLTGVWVERKDEGCQKSPQECGDTDKRTPQKK